MKNKMQRGKSACRTGRHVSRSKGRALQKEGTLNSFKNRAGCPFLGEGHAVALFGKVSGGFGKGKHFSRRHRSEESLIGCKECEGNSRKNYARGRHRGKSEDGGFFLRWENQNRELEAPENRE